MGCRLHGCHVAVVFVDLRLDGLSLAIAGRGNEAEHGSAATRADRVASLWSIAAREAKQAQLSKLRMENEMLRRNEVLARSQTEEIERLRDENRRLAAENKRLVAEAAAPAPAPQRWPSQLRRAAPSAGHGAPGHERVPRHRLPLPRCPLPVAAAAA